jgi:hypothetical protein
MRFDVLMAVSTNITIFWDVIPYRSQKTVTFKFIWPFLSFDTSGQIKDHQYAILKLRNIPV